MLELTTARPFDFVLNEPLQILAVDDDPIQREFCKVYLSTPTACITAVACAEDGLELLEKQRFDMALIDVDMPGMNGIEMVHRLRSDARFDDLPVMMITGREDINSIDLAYEAGATAFMCKPVNWRLLSHQVKFFLRAHRAIRQTEHGDA